MSRVGRLYVVIPCYNEQEVLWETRRRLEEKLYKMIAENTISDRSRIVYIQENQPYYGC